MSRTGTWGLFARRDDNDPNRCEPRGDGYLGDVVSRNGRHYALIRSMRHETYDFVDIETGKSSAEGIPAAEESWGRAPTGGDTAVIEKPGHALSLYDPSTGMEMASTLMPGWHPVYGMPSKLLLMRDGRDSYAVDAIAAYEPADSFAGWIAPGPATSAPPASGNTPSCPTDSVQLAFARFALGWVLVCGVRDDQPTLWRWSIDGTVAESRDVLYQEESSRFISTWQDDSWAWVSSAPAMVGQADADGWLTASWAANEIWFVHLGTNMPTTGASGVTVPQATDADQVRYLSELLARSAAARAELVPAVDTLTGCKHGSRAGGYGGELATIESVAGNRSALLLALQTAPVDRVPDGVNLVNMLVAGLANSHEADLEFADWARQINQRGCPSGSSKAAVEASTRAGTAKTAFAKAWNETIAPRYGVPTVSREKL